MERASFLLATLAALVLVGLCVEVAVAHESFRSLCVCVVNAMARSAVASFGALIIGVVSAFGSATGLYRSKASWLLAVQSLLLIASFFFVVQHIFFALGIA